MAKENNKQEESTETPLCEKCGNAKIWEAFEAEDSKGEWVCPHCQGEIDFLGERDE